MEREVNIDCDWVFWDFERGILEGYSESKSGTESAALFLS